MHHCDNPDRELVKPASFDYLGVHGQSCRNLAGSISMPKALGRGRRGSELSAFGGGRQGYFALFHGGFKQIVSLLEHPVST
jgi:hypothetical protein